jgi:OOP family OmpA-OmpF porin
MNINSKIIAAALLLGAIVSPAMAEGFYGALDVGQSTGKDACKDISSGLPPGSTWAGCKDTATLFRVAGGFQISPMWGAEVSYGDYGKASLGSGTVNDPVLGMVAMSADYQASGIQISGTGSFPVGNAFSLIGKVGIARTDLKLTATALGVSVSQSATSANLAYGIGAQYAFNEKVSVRAQYEDLGNVGDDNTGKSKVTLLSAGLVYKF